MLLRETQMGGLPNRGVDVASLTLRAQLQAFRNLGLSTAVLFVDVRQAYYRALRQLISPAVAADDLEETIVGQLADSPLTAGLFRALLAAPSILEESGLDDHLAQLVGNAFSGSFFAVNGCGSVAASRRGTGPGMVLADFAFSLLLAPILDEVTQAWKEAGVRPAGIGVRGPFQDTLATSCSSEAACDSTFADDTAFLSVIPSQLHPEALAEHLASLSRPVIAAFKSRALDLGFGPKKSAWMILAAGRGARAHAGGGGGT